MTSSPMVYVRGPGGEHRDHVAGQSIVATPRVGDAVFAVEGMLFDLDNTLFDRDRTFLHWAQWFVREHMGIGDADKARPVIDLLVELDANGYGPKDVLFHRLKERFPHVVENVHTLTAAFFQDHLAYVEPDDDTQHLLLQLRDYDIPWGIVTNGSSNQLRKIERLGFGQWTACVFVSELEGIRKPDARIFLRAAQCLGIAPNRILFVGDNPHADIAGAQAVGMRTAWFHRRQTWPSTLRAHVPDLVIDSLASLTLAPHLPATSGVESPPVDQ